MLYPGYLRFMSLSYFMMLLCLLLGCGSSGPKATTDLDSLLKKQAREKSEIERLNEQLFAQVRSAPRFQDYVLGSGDLISVKVFEDEELNCETRIGARGCVTLPLLGEVRLAGLSTRQAEQKVEDLYQLDFLQDPHVTVFVEERFGSKISVLGEVKEPGTYDHFSTRRLLDALALAGGLSENAGRTVQVRRPAQDQAKPETYLLDLDRLVEEGQLDLNIPIRGGDVVYVPKAGLVYVDGAVREPGNYPIESGMTVQEAIVAAGGYTVSANLDTIRLIRMMDDGQREVVNLSSESQKAQSRELLEVQERDVIFVETDSFRDALYSLRIHFWGHLLGFGYDPPRYR